jgi:hypothetical protein
LHMVAKGVGFSTAYNLPFAATSCSIRWHQS